MRRLISFLLCSSLPATMVVVSASPAAAATACEPRQFKACSVADFLEQAKQTRAHEDVRPVAASDHVVARFTSRGRAEAAARRLGSRVLETIDGNGTVTLDVPTGDRAGTFAKDLRDEAGAVYAEVDRRARTFGQVTDWGVGDIHAPEAAISNAVTGTGVKVAVVDTGVDYTHSDLDSNIWSNTGEIVGNGTDDDGNGFVDDARGYDFIGDFYTAVLPDPDPMDDAGHGSHVAGIVAAEDNSFGVRGVAPDATIMPVKVLDSTGAGWNSTVAAGIRYAVDNGADIINMSLGSYAPSGALTDAVAYAAANDVAIVAAAGNFFFYSLGLQPAAIPSVISVAAARESDHTKTWWSDWGHADFLAPGDAILSTTPANNYDRFSGTSMASPHVAGALALVKQAHPTFDPIQLEQTLGSTAIDSYFAGKDEVSGAGFPDVEAATAVLPAQQVQLSRAPYLIHANGDTASAITLKILDGAGLPVAGVSGIFTTDMGTLSTGVFTTNAAGEATTELTADDIHGSATVTATPAGYPVASVRVIIEDDRVRVDDIVIEAPEVETPPEEEPPGPDSIFIPPTPGEVDPFMPGEDIIVRGYFGRHNFLASEPRVSFAYSVTGPGGPVPELSGAFEPITAFGFGAQITAASMPHTIPETAPEGTYTIEGTLTTIKPEGNEEHTFSKTFVVGDPETEILLVRSGVSFDAETLNYFFAYTTDSVVRRELEAMGRSVTYWDVPEGGNPPSFDEMRKHQTVVWLGGWDGDLPVDALSQYLELGGNLLLSGELYGSIARIDGSKQYKDFMHAIGLLTLFFPDDNHQIYPASVLGSAGGVFDGVTFDLNAYDLNHNGQATSIFDDEFVLNAADGAAPLFTWPSGVNSPSVAGVTVDTGTYRVVNLGFGLESIDDGASPATLADALDTLLNGFETTPSITDVSPNVVLNGGEDGFVVTGTGFQPTGITHLRLDSTELEDVLVLDRGTIVVSVPKGFPVGTYDVTVENPDGSADTVADAVIVDYPHPNIRSVTPAFASNDRARAIRVDGSFFRPGAKVRVAGIPLATTYVNAKRLTARLLSGFTPLGPHGVSVTNPDGKGVAVSHGLLVRYGFRYGVGLGDTDPAVRHLKVRLRAYGFFPKNQPITSGFGPVTQKALKNYQKSRGLVQSGYLNLPTRQRLNETR